MKLKYFFLVAFFAMPFVIFGQQSKPRTEKVKSELITFTVSQDAVEPPPPNFRSKFKDIQEWLVHVIATNKPLKRIDEFRFDLFESPDEYILSLTGANNYKMQNNHSETRIEFRPKDLYFSLPKSYFINLHRQQLIKKLTEDLINFSKTEVFKTSFFTQANDVILDTNGQKIWSK